MLSNALRKCDFDFDACPYGFRARQLLKGDTMREITESKPDLDDDEEIPPFEAKDQGAEDERYDNIPCTD